MRDSQPALLEPEHEFTPYDDDGSCRADVFHADRELRSRHPAGTSGHGRAIGCRHEIRYLYAAATRSDACADRALPRSAGVANSDGFDLSATDRPGGALAR